MKPLVWCSHCGAHAPAGGLDCRVCGAALTIAKAPLLPPTEIVPPERREPVRLARTREDKQA